MTVTLRCDNSECSEFGDVRRVFWGVALRTGKHTLAHLACKGCGEPPTLLGVTEYTQELVREIPAATLVVKAE